LRWYASLRSPYSWLALHDATTRYRDFWEACELRLFFEPDRSSSAALTEAGGSFPYVPMSRAKHFYILRDVARLAAARGLRPVWPVDRDPVWEVPTLAVLGAAEQGDAAARELTVRLSRARFEQGADICDPDIVAAVLTGCGLDPALARRTDDEQLRAAGLRELLGVHQDGVFGVPFFVVGREPFWGLDRLDAAAWAASALPVDRGVPPPSGPLLPVPAGADLGPAGGCG
jgi:2-hydroxychromene-2-carboxylate isomerase